MDFENLSEKSANSFKMIAAPLNVAEMYEFDPLKGAANLSVSRNHARISYDPAQKKYFLLADEGGLPSRGNKIKIFKTTDAVIRADVLGMNYELADGDQIELGGETKLLFQIS